MHYLNDSDSHIDESTICIVLPLKIHIHVIKTAIRLVYEYLVKTIQKSKVAKTISINLITKNKTDLQI